MQIWFYIIYILIGIILYKLLNLKEGLSIGGWVRYYFIDSDGTSTLINTDQDDYDPNSPSPAPNDDQHLLIIHGSGRIPTLPGTNQVFEEEYQRRFDEIMESYDFNTTNQVEVMGLDLQGSIRSSDATEVLPGCQSLSTTSPSDNKERHIQRTNLRASPRTGVSQLRDTLLLTFYTPYGIEIVDDSQDHMDSPIHPESFHMAYINSNGHYTTRRGRDRSVEDLATSVNRWFNQRFVPTSPMDEWGDQEGYISPHFSELTLGNMESYNFQTGFGFLSFLRRKSQSIDRCIEFIEIVKRELVRNRVSLENFNLTIHIYYDRFSPESIIDYREFPANILVYTFNNTNINDLLNNLFLINILFNEEDIAHTENPLSGACASRRSSDPGGGE